MPHDDLPYVQTARDISLHIPWWPLNTSLKTFAGSEWWTYLENQIGPVLDGFLTGLFTYHQLYLGFTEEVDADLEAMGAYAPEVLEGLYQEALHLFQAREGWPSPLPFDLQAQQRGYRPGAPRRQCYVLQMFARRLFPCVLASLVPSYDPAFVDRVACVDVTLTPTGIIIERFSMPTVTTASGTPLRTNHSDPVHG